MSQATKTPPSPGKLILGIEACTPALSVALVDAEGRLRACDWCEAARPASHGLMAMVDRALRGVGAGPGDLMAVGVTHGPGAFTGLRVGLALAKSLAWGLGCSLYSYSTLAMLAKRAPSRETGLRIVPLLDARRSEVYRGLYRSGATSSLEPDQGDRVESIDATLEALATHDGKFLLTGNGAEIYREALASGLGERAIFLAPPWNRPGADVVALAAWHAWTAGEPGIDPMQCEPAYLRASDAEKRFRVELPMGWSTA